MDTANTHGASVQHSPSHESSLHDLHRRPALRPVGRFQSIATQEHRFAVKLTYSWSPSPALTNLFNYLPIG
jgi:hypothetical protein